jgi:hypothetical protein
MSISYSGKSEEGRGKGEEEGRGEWREEGY